MRVNICIPHYAKGETDQTKNMEGYGSLREGEQLHRAFALNRCLTSLLKLQRRMEMTIFNIHEKKIDHFPANHSPLEINIKVYTDGKNQLSHVLDLFKSKIERVDVETNNPKDLPLICRDQLISERGDADMLMYLEDDLIIHDEEFFDKQYWFLNRTEHRFSLMPHRFEPINTGAIHQFLVDGPLSPGYIGQFLQPQQNAGKGMYKGRETVVFDIPNNPHSGCFVISAEQAEELSKTELPRDGFVGPLETAATYTVLHRYPIMKPSLTNWRFLQIEHGHPSFLGFLNTLPHQILNEKQGEEDGK